MGENLAESVALGRHHCSAYLAQTDSVSPAAAVEHKGISFPFLFES